MHLWIWDDVLSSAEAYLAAFVLVRIPVHGAPMGDSGVRPDAP